MDSLSYTFFAEIISFDIAWTDFWTIIRTGASILIPILAVYGRLYFAKRDLETQGLIMASNTEIKELIQKHKEELAETIGNLQISIGKMEEGNGHRDTEIERINDRLEFHLNKN